MIAVDLRKYYREGGSEKHLRDIVGVLKVQGKRIDRGYIMEWATNLGLSGEWETALTWERPERLRQLPPDRLE